MLRFLNRHSVRLILATLSISSVCVATAIAANWPNFRGVDRSAVSKETGLLQEWPADGPPLLWDTKGAGRGYSTVAVADNKIYTLGDGLSDSEDKDEYLVCFSEEKGQPLWKTKTGSPWVSGQPNWQSSRGTPAVDGDIVCVVTPHGVLICCETSTGKELWRKDFKQDFAGKKGDGWGYSESVVIDPEQVVCTPGGDQSTMVALDRKTGELKWKAARANDRGAGHSSIVPCNIAGTRVYVQSTASGPMGVRASDGKLLWEYEVQQTTAVCPTPLVRDDLVLFVDGYGKGGAALLKQVPGENGEIAIQEIYPLNSKLANKHGGVVLVGDYIFGDSDDKGIPYCADLMTGTIQWAKRGSGANSASFAAADGRLYIRFANGVISLAKASPEAFEEVGSFKVPHSGDRPSWSHPVIVNGHLYLREQDYIMCYDVRAK